MPYTKTINLNINSSPLNQKIDELKDIQNNSPQLLNNKEALENLKKASLLFKKSSETLSKNLKEINIKKFSSEELSQIQGLKDQEEASSKLRELWDKKEESARSNVNENWQSLLKEKHTDSFGQLNTEAFNQEYAMFLQKFDEGITNWQEVQDSLSSPLDESQKIVKDALTELSQTQKDFVYKFNQKDLTGEEKEEYNLAKKEGRGQEYLSELGKEKESLWKKEMEGIFSSQYKKLTQKFTRKDGSVDLGRVQEKFNSFKQKVSKVTDKKGIKAATNFAAAKSGKKLAQSVDFKKMKLDKLKNIGSIIVMFIKQSFDMANKVLKSIGIDFSGVWDTFKNAFKDAVEEFKKMTAFRSDGRYTSLEKQEEMAELGASSDSEFYGIKKAMEKLGMSKDEFFMGGVNEERNKALEELIEIEKTKYENLKRTGALDKMAEMQEKWEDFQTEMRSQIMKIVAEVAPLILTVLNGILDVVRPMLEGLNIIAKLIGDDSLTEEQVNSEIDTMLNNSIQSVANNNIAITNNMHSVNPGMSNRHQLEKAGQQNGITVARALGY